MYDFAERINELIDSNNMTIKSLADAAGLSYTTVYNLAKGKVYSPTTETTQAISKVFGMSMERFLGYEEVDYTVTHLDEYEMTMINYIRAMGQTDKDRLKGYAEAILGR